MKKNYIQPTTNTVSVELQQMVATSIGFGEGTKDGSDGTSRRHSSVWDDEYDDEEF